MSHNVSIGSVKLDDLKAVERALAEINKENGINFVLTQEATTIRGWQGQREKVDAAIHTGDKFRYDIGLIKQADGTYLPRYENLAGSDFGKVLGVQAGAHGVDGKAMAGIGMYGRNEADFVGRLVQRTNVIKAEQEAARKGMSARRSVDNKTGLISLSITGGR